MESIKVLIAYDDDEIRNHLTLILNQIENVEVIGESNNPYDLCEKIKKLKPSMVFLKYNFSDKINGIDIIKMCENIVNEELPIFNFITDNLSKEEFIEIKSLIGDKMNSIIRENSDTRFKEIIEDYIAYIKNKKG